MRCIFFDGFENNNFEKQTEHVAIINNSFARTGNYCAELVYFQNNISYLKKTFNEDMTFIILGCAFYIQNGLKFMNDSVYFLSFGDKFFKKCYGLSLDVRNRISLYEFSFYPINTKTLIGRSRRSVDITKWNYLQIGYGYKDGIGIIQIFLDNLLIFNKLIDFNIYEDSIGYVMFGTDNTNYIDNLSFLYIDDIYVLNDNVDNTFLGPVQIKSINFNVYDSTFIYWTDDNTNNLLKDRVPATAGVSDMSESYIVLQCQSVLPSDLTILDKHLNIYGLHEGNFYDGHLNIKIYDVHKHDLLYSYDTELIHGINKYDYYIPNFGYNEQNLNNIQIQIKLRNKCT